MQECVTCAVLVVGGGGAALRAALAAYETSPSLDICLVCKGQLGASGVTATACSDRMAFHATLQTTEPGGDDNWQAHAEDIYRIGGYVSDGDLAAILARRSAEAFSYLQEAGVPWVWRADGQIDQFLTDGSRYARACYTGPYTANHIEKALHDRLRSLPIRVRDNTMVAELVRDTASGAIVGAWLVSERDGRITFMRCRAVILAAGGAGQVFGTNVYPADCTGDGYALAYRAGAELVNLEFIQIGLCSVKTNLACSGSMMRALPHLVNEAGSEFLRDYCPTGMSEAEMYQMLYAKGASWPVSYNDPSHLIDIAVSREISKGQRVYLDYRSNPQGLRNSLNDPRWKALRASIGETEAGDWATASTPYQRLQRMNQPAIDWLNERGVNLAAEMIEIAPAVQHFQGGVKINASAATTVPGLFAAGETAGGQHGANRPGGHALLDCQVFGRIAGESAARWCRTALEADPGADDENALLHQLFTPDGAPAQDIRQLVRATMDAVCGVYRTTAGLAEGLKIMRALRKRRLSQGSLSLARAIETANILTVGELVLTAALARRESRGPHLRFASDASLEPIPNDPAWQQYLVIHRGQTGPVLERRTPVQLTLPGAHDMITSLK